MDAFTGEIRLFAGNFPPQDWTFCNGDILDGRQYPALFSLLGNTYGGSVGQQTFAVPNLQGRVTMGTGQGNGLTYRKLGDASGTESVGLVTSQMPVHSHLLNGKSGTTLATGKNDPTGAVWRDGQNVKNFASGVTPDVTMADKTVSDFGGTSPSGQATPHNNVQPCVGIHYIICVNGFYPEFD